jgi:hypothetical protein
MRVVTQSLAATVLLLLSSWGHGSPPAKLTPALTVHPMASMVASLESAFGSTTGTACWLIKFNNESQPADVVTSRIMEELRGAYPGTTMSAAQEEETRRIVSERVQAVEAGCRLVRVGWWPRGAAWDYSDASTNCDPAESVSYSYLWSQDLAENVVIHILWEPKQVLYEAARRVPVEPPLLGEFSLGTRAVLKSLQSGRGHVTTSAERLNDVITTSIVDTAPGNKMPLSWRLRSKIGAGGEEKLVGEALYSGERLMYEWSMVWDTNRDHVPVSAELVETSPQPLTRTYLFRPCGNWSGNSAVGMAIEADYHARAVVDRLHAAGFTIRPMPNDPKVKATVTKLALPITEDP